MRVLLDECLPRRLKRHLSRHNVVTVPEAGWAGRKNGALLQAAAGNFDAFITIDRNLAYQQHMDELPFIVVVLVARTSRLADLLPLVPDVLDALNTSTAGQVIRVGG